MQGYVEKVEAGAGVPYNHQSRLPSQGDPELQGHGPIPGGYTGVNGPYGHALGACGTVADIYLGPKFWFARAGGGLGGLLCLSLIHI